MEQLIYLDNAATTPLAPEVLDAMMPYFTKHYGNASSISHRMGRIAAEATERARNQVAELIDASPKEIIFTSGATESINMSLKGIFEHYTTKGRHIITCKTEHKAMLDTCGYLARKGAEITYLPVDNQGNISLDSLEKAIRPDTILVAFMAVNNETGVIHPMNDIAKICAKKDVLSFCDATQAAGKIPINLTQTPIDLLCMSSHKLHGPKGIGALYIRRKRSPIQIGSWLHGGGQENKLRAGTLNVPAIAGFGVATQIAQNDILNTYTNTLALQKTLENKLQTLPEVIVHATDTLRSPYISNICIRHLSAAEIMVKTPGLALSSGSACVSGDRAPSHVLLAMNISPEDAHSSIRFSLSRYTQIQDINDACMQIIETIERLRQESPVWQLFKNGLID